MGGVGGVWALFFRISMRRSLFALSCNISYASSVRGGVAIYLHLGYFGVAALIHFDAPLPPDWVDSVEPCELRMLRRPPPLSSSATRQISAASGISGRPPSSTPVLRTFRRGAGGDTKMAWLGRRMESWRGALQQCMSLVRSKRAHSARLYSRAEWSRL